MRLRSTLLQIATLLSTVPACSSGGAGALSDSDAGRAPDGGPTKDASSDAGPDGSVVGCGGCNCGAPATTQGNATPAQACAILGEAPVGGPACKTFCGALPGNTATPPYYCTVAADYQSAYASAQPEGGTSADAGATCPTWGNDVVVHCGYTCLGRRTDGIAEPIACDETELGAVFASRAYLEAVSIHAFARLERELAFHGAPPSLLQAARRARREEIRHTAMTVRLARRFGADVSRFSLPKAPRETAPRTLFDIARENAVEGCVRETYGAVIGLLEASTSSDVEVRRASRTIARDECGHAELAMDVARWIEPLLTPSERAAVRAAADDAIADLAARGDARVVALLRSQVWAAA